MKPRWMTGLLLAGIWAFGSGASMDGVREAREWQHAGDVARLFGQDVVAYHFYDKVATTFPGTRHGRFCAKRARATWGQLRALDRTSALGEGTLAEAIDFFSW
jgi:hypothetical protein